MKYRISFPDFEPSDAIRADVEHYLQKIDSMYDRIVSCNVTIKAPHMHKRNHIYHIHIHLKLPRKSLVVNHEPEKDFDHTDMHIAIRDAFAALRRQLRRHITKINKDNRFRGDDLSA